MHIPIYQIDAFAEKVFQGNPAAVCILEKWIDDNILQKIAYENNLSETAFCVPIKNNNYHIRWFTPLIEVNLCGHATLATAHALYHHLCHKHNKFIFSSKSGNLEINTIIINKDKASFEMLLPATNLYKPKLIPPALIQSLGNIKPKEILQGEDYVVIYSDENIIKNLQPDFNLLQQLDLRAVVVSAKSSKNGIDFISRVFAPKLGVNEDPVTGSTHCALVPYWANILNKLNFTAEQISNRGGILKCVYHPQNNKVAIIGSAATFMQGIININ